MINQFSSEKQSPEKNIVSNPRALFMMLISSKREILEKMNFTITEEKVNIIQEEWYGNQVIKSCDWVVKICKHEQELILR
jgi:hypothetical protein